MNEITHKKKISGMKVELTIKNDFVVLDIKNTGNNELANFISKQTDLETLAWFILGSLGKIDPLNIIPNIDLADNGKIARIIKSCPDCNSSLFICEENPNTWTNNNRAQLITFLCANCREIMFGSSYLRSNTILDYYKGGEKNVE